MIETPLNEAPITDIIVTPPKETYYAKYTYEYPVNSANIQNIYINHNRETAERSSRKHIVRILAVIIETALDETL